MNRQAIAGIRRGSQFSPNHVGNDAAIFSLAAMRLRDAGYMVNEYIESDLLVRPPEELYLFNMVRDKQSVRLLQQWEKEGRCVVNSGFGIENCTREKMTRLLTENRIPHPSSIILDTGKDPREALGQAGFQHCWIKRGDFHAIHREDVTYVRNPEEAGSILKEYAIRGIPTAVINEHLTGDLVKFYGVTGTGFFYWFYPTDLQYSKFGWEQINGAAQGFRFHTEELITICNRAAQLLNIHIYGGDCIISEDGTIRLIDFNDWPSFAPCRDEASFHIAGRILHIFETNGLRQV